MKTMQAVLSWGDASNFCTVLNAELHNDELFLLLCVEGIEYAPEDAEVVAYGSRQFSFAGRRLCQDGCSQQPRPQSQREGNTFTLVFDCPPEVQCSGEVHFSYAPGYTCVSILDLILSSFIQERPGIPNSLWCDARSDNAGNELPFKPSSPIFPQSLLPHSLKVWEDDRQDPFPDTLEQHVSVPMALRPTQPRQSQLDQAERPSKSYESNSGVVAGVMGDVGQFPLPSPPTNFIATGASSETFFSVVGTGHERIMPVLERRLAAMATLRKFWEAGDMQGIVAALETSRDDVLLCGTLERLELKAKQPMPPRALARILPLAQRLSQSKSEVHAVVAMRSTIKMLEASWPAVSHALQNVATPKAIFDDCQAAVQSASSLFAVVKAMSRSVRISRSNGPLIPICRKLKTCLEEALVSVGRLRGAN